MLSTINLLSTLGVQENMNKFKHTDLYSLVKRFPLLDYKESLLL